jgi:hypothetical protein
MSGRASALAALGLEPGADAAAIEQAYKRLIKKHHPDREGGDSRRAAEINRAYRELRGGKAQTDPLQFNDDRLTAHKGRRWALAGMMAAIVAGALSLSIDPRVPTPALRAATARLGINGSGKAALAEPMDGQLHTAAIDLAVQEALHLFRTRDELALADASRECQRELREKPGTAMLDRCAAFDDAVVGLEDRDPLRDEGPFAPLAVTGRQWSAASALSDDDLAIDSRLDRIRLRVEMALAPQVAPVAPATSD